MTMLESAIEYACRGWKIFPLSPNSKIPFAGTKGVKEATDDIEVIRAWWAVHPDANIGLACGEASGVWVVDVDVGHKSGIDGFMSLAQNGISLPTTLTQATPSGGCHYLYKCDGEKPANKNSFLDGVDIRGDGYYIVLAPSVFEGKAYRWENNAELAEYPNAAKPKKRISEAFPWATKPVTPRPWEAPKADIGNKLERARAYLAEVPGAIQGCGGHNALLWAAQCMVQGFELSDAEALDLLWNEYNPRCSPPWDRGNKSDVKDFERKVKEARAKPLDKPNGWLLAESDFVQPYELDPNADDAFIKMLLGKNENKNALPEAPKEEPQKEEDDDIPSALLNPPGLVGKVSQWLDETSGCPQPLLSLGASLVFCGALMGRKVKDESGGRTNLYALGVGHSSAGKDHALKNIPRIIQAASAENLLGGEVTSDTAIENALRQQPVKLFFIDEIGRFFQTINKSGGNTPHLKTIVPMFMKLFSSAGSLYVGKQKAGKEENVARLDQPCVGIWGVTSPQVFYDSMTETELQDGWTARNLIFITETRPKYHFVREAVIPQNIVTLVDAWFRRVIPVPEGEGNLSILKAHQIVVPTSDEAWVVFNDFRDFAYDKMISADRSGERTNYLWGKAFENARRIALIVACGENYEKPSIERKHAQYACDLVRFLVRRAIKYIKANFAANAFEKEKMKILALVEKAGKKGLSKSDLVRRTRYVRDIKTRDSYLQELIVGSQVVVVSVKTKTKPSVRYIAAKFAPRELLPEEED